VAGRCFVHRRLSRVVNVLVEFLRGHKVHSQNQKEKNGCEPDFSLGKFHFCDLIVVDFAASVGSR
jgi:hypothetical protein